MEENQTDKQPAILDTRPPLRDEERQPCEIWTRVMGYHRPVSAFNRGKKQEYAERVPFRESAAMANVSGKP